MAPFGGSKVAQTRLWGPKNHSGPHKKTFLSKVNFFEKKIFRTPDGRPAGVRPGPGLGVSGAPKGVQTVPWGPKTLIDRLKHTLPHLKVGPSGQQLLA